MIEDFERLAEGQLAGDLAAEEARTFAAHLATCAACRARFEAHSAAAAGLAELSTAPLAAMSAGFTDKVLRRLPPGPPPPAAPAAASTGAILLAVGAGVALLVAGAFLYRARPGGAPVRASATPDAGPSASASNGPSAAPSASASPAPLPPVARPSGMVGDLGDDGGDGRVTR